MLRHPVVLTSLEEDMKKLGLMVETAPAPRVALSKSEMDELESMGESEDLDPDASPEEVEEAMRRAAGSGKMVKTKRMSSGERAAAKKYYKQNKGRIKKARAKFAKSSRGKKLAKIAARFSKESIEDGLLDVLEAFDVLLDFRGRSFDGADVSDVSEAFASLSTIAEAVATKVENPALAEARDEAKGVADTVLEATDDLDADELDDNFEALACKVADAIHEWAGLAEAARKMVPPGKPGRPNSGEDEDDEEEEEEDEEEEDDEEECDEDVAEAMRRAAGSGKMVKTQKMTAGEKADAKKYYKQNKGKIAKQAAKRAKSASGQKLAKIAAKFTKEEESISDPVVALEAAVNDYPGTFEGLTAERAAVMFEHAATAAKEFEKNAEGSAASLLRIVGGQATALKESLVGTDVVSNTKYFDSMFESIVTALVGHGEDVAAGAESDDEEETVSYTESDFDLFHFSREEIAEGMKKFGSDYRIQMIRGVVEGND